MPGLNLRCLLASLYIGATLLCAPGAMAQDVVDDDETPDDATQLLMDTDALVIGTLVSTRCALYDSTLPYLTPLEWSGAEIRLRQYEAMLASEVEDAADEISQMHSEAAAIACGSEGLAPFLAFSRQVAQDVVDIGLVSLRTIDIGRCSYFADNEFLEAVDNASAVAEARPIEGDSARVNYIEQTAASWVAVFEQNCTNLAFDPTETLPGKIALAVPQPQ